MPCRQMQVDQGKYLIHSIDALVQPHGPHADKTFGICDISCGPAYIRLGYAAQSGGFFDIVPEGGFLIGG